MFIKMFCIFINKNIYFKGPLTNGNHLSPTREMGQPWPSMKQSNNTLIIHSMQRVSSFFDHIYLSNNNYSGQLCGVWCTYTES